MQLRVSDLELLELARWSADNFTISVCLAKGQHPVSLYTVGTQDIDKRRAGRPLFLQSGEFI